VSIAEKALNSVVTKTGLIGNVEYRIGSYSFTNEPQNPNDRRLRGLPGGGI
jgi:hypothetical protein